MVQFLKHNLLIVSSAVGAAALNDRLYVCGGYDGVSSLNTVECYQPDTDAWTTITPMQKHRSAGGVIGFEGYVYALGGHDGLSIFDSVSVEIISKIKSLVTIIEPLIFAPFQTGRCSEHTKS